jgi:hypothetical protein
MLRAAPDALRVTKRSFDAALEVGDIATAMELEERGQVLIIRQGAALRAAAAANAQS